MERKFLENLKVGDQPLTKEIIDAIIEENGRDIEAAKKPFADYDHIKGQLATAQETIKGLEGQDIEGVRKSAKDWEEKYNQAIADHKKQMDDLAFNGIMKDAIAAAKGRDAVAIMAVMGDEQINTLRSSKNQAVDIKTALETLQKDKGYLFGDDQGVPPPYAANTGTGAGGKSTTGLAAIRAAAGLKNE